MGWIAVALISAAVSGVLSIVDKQVLSKYVPIRSFSLLLALMSIVWGIGTLIAVPISSTVSLNIAVMSALSGLLWGSGLLLYFFVLRREEVSRTSPVFHTYPVIVAILGVSLLDEALNALQWMAILLTIAGAVLISSRGAPGRTITLGRSFGLLILASSIAAVGQFMSKYALEEAPFWNFYALRSLGFSLPFLIFLSRDSVRGLYESLKHPAARYYLLGGEVAFASLSVLLTIVAISLGPISIVAALVATRPVFVFIYSTLLSNPKWKVMDEPLTRDILAVKTTAIALVVVGVGALSVL